MEKHRSTIGLNLSVFLFMFGVGLIVPLLPRKILTLSGSLKTVGYLASAFAVSYVLLQFPIGRLADRFGFKKFLLTGYLFCSVSGLLYYFSNTQGVIFWGRFIQGVGEAPLWALAPALLSILYPGANGKVIGLYNASLHLGLTMGSGFGILVSEHWVRNEPFLLFSLLGLSGAVVIFAMVREPEVGVSTGAASIGTGGGHRLYRDPGILVVFSAILLYGAGYGIALTVLPGFLIQDKGFTQAEIGWFFMFFYIAISLSQVLIGPVSDRYGRGRTMVWGLLMASVGLMLFPGQDGWKVYPWLFLASTGFGVLCVSALAWLNNAVGDALKGTISGAFYLFWGIGFFSAPLVLGVSGIATQTSTGYYLLAVLFFLQALLQGAMQYRNGKKHGKTDVCSIESASPDIHPLRGMNRHETKR
jgi:MFS family permease